MMKKYIYGGVVTLLLVGVVAIPSANAETTSNTAMLEQIKVLMAKLEDLQKQLAEIRGEVKSTLKAGLSEGMSDADVAKLQELLATDPTIYPEGKKTGYFGPLTRDAIKRFQARHELEVTGKIDEETHDLLEEYLHEGFGDKIPAGLLKAPGITKKVQDRFLLGCEKREGSAHGMGPLCKKWKGEHEQDDDDSDDDANDDADEENEDFDVEVEIEDGDTTVTFTFEGDDYEVVVDNSTKLSEVLDAVAEDIQEGDDASDLDSKLKSAIAKKFVKAVADASDDEDFDVEVEIEDGDTTVTFTFEGDDYEVVVDNSTDLDDILDAVADKMNDGDDASDLDEDLADNIEDALDDAEEEN